MRALDAMLDKLRLQHKSHKTAKCYRHWVLRYAAWLRKLDAQAAAMDSERRVESFLSDLARGALAASTQNQAFNALLYFCQHGIGTALREGIQSLRAKRLPGSLLTPLLQHLSREAVRIWCRGHRA
jgi:site-specific recombinase XerD